MTRVTLSRRRLRQGALGGVVLLVAAYASVLYTVTNVVGMATTLLGVLAGSLLFATVLARAVRPLVALVVTLLALAGGLYVYLTAVPPEALALVTPAGLGEDTVLLLTGLSVLRLLAAGTWALSLAPAPTFLAWYLALRRRYAAAVAVAGATLALFVLTGDADATTTLVGVVAGTLAVGLGTLELATPVALGPRGDDDRDAAAEGGDRPRPRWAGSERGGVGAGRHGQNGPGVDATPGVVAQLESLTAVVAAMVLLSATVGLATGGGTGGGGGGGGGGVTAANLASAADELRVQGTISLSPKVAMVVTSNREATWRTGVFDRYTGDGWVRTGGEEPYPGRLPGPPGETERIQQQVTPYTPMTVLPAANQPVSVAGVEASRTLVTAQGTLRPSESLGFYDNFTVVSERPVASAEQLRAAGDDYPARLAQSSLELPDSTPDRVRERAAQVAGEEATAYDKAVAIERHLEETKSYSLTVERPSGDVAAGFLFEMDAGYCIYFATAMVVMLRSQGVPARFAVGYTAGQELAGDALSDTYVVRGLDSHAWVEVYFPDVGWVAFDPTPAGPRVEAERESLRAARSRGDEDIDAMGSEDSGPTPTPTPTSTVNGSAAANLTLTEEAPGAFGATAGPMSGLPSGRTLGLGLVALLGAVASVRRWHLRERTREALGLYYQGRQADGPAVARAWSRVERDLARRYRPRRPGESTRAYVRALAAEHDLHPWVADVQRFHEAAHYGDGVTHVQARGAVDRADVLTRRSLVLVGWYYRRRARAAR